MNQRALTIISFITLFLSSCSKEVLQNDIETLTLPDSTQFTKYTIQQGSHYSTPLNTSAFFKSCNINGEAYFTHSSIYNLHNSDQSDWNKLNGFKLDYNSVPSHAAMIVWRYDTIDSIFEVAPYFNKNGIVFPDTSEIIQVGLYETFTFNAKLKGKKATLKIVKDSIVVEKQLDLKNALLFTSVSIYFGGNAVAPNKIEVWMKD